METRTDRLKIASESGGLLRGITASLGSVWASRRSAKKTESVRLVYWAGRATSDSWFLFELEQRKNRSLYHYARNQVR